MCECVFVHVSTCDYVYGYACVYTYIYKCVFCAIVFKHMCVCVYTFVYAHVCTHLCMGFLGLGFGLGWVGFVHVPSIFQLTTSSFYLTSTYYTYT